MVFSQRQSEAFLDCRAYKWTEPFTVLGCRIGTSGNAWCDFDAASAAIWRRMWAGSKSRAARNVPLKIKILDVERCCWPSLSFRCSWWAVSRTLLSEIESLQNSIVSCLLRLPIEPGEDRANYHRRRGREALKFVQNSKCWKRKVCERIRSWSEHVDRAHFWSWAIEIAKCRDNLWLRGQRKVMHSISVFAGSLGTRDSPGRPYCRWQEALDLVHAELSDEL